MKKNQATWFGVISFVIVASATYLFFKMKRAGMKPNAQPAKHDQAQARIRKVMHKSKETLA